jgi:hypothetical protein
MIVLKLAIRKRKFVRKIGGKISSEIESDDDFFVGLFFVILLILKEERALLKLKNGVFSIIQKNESSFMDV